MFSRRETLCGGTAAAAAIAGAGTVAFATTREADPLVELERQWETALAEIEAIGQPFDKAYAALPDWAKGGWPDVSDLPEFTPLHGVGPRPSLTAVRASNARFLRIYSFFNPEADLEPLRAQGRARVRAWIARRREQLALKRQVGAHDIDERLEPYYLRRDAIEDQIEATPATSYVGLAVKLRLVAEYCKRDYTVEDLLQSMLQDAERLAKEGV